MSKLQTLNEIDHLKQSGFGQPRPRHGLKLLHWFATNCVSFDKNNEMVSLCNPAAGDFGFHFFENRAVRDGVRLLPHVDFPYYAVGNLNPRLGGDLPDYIKEEYTGERDRSNIDRMIVSLDGEWFDKVYVSAHTDESNFDINSTYRISKSLLMIITRQTLEEFLNDMGYQRKPKDRFKHKAQAFYSQPISKTAYNATQKQEYHIKMAPAVSPQNNNQTNCQSHNSTRSQGFWETFCTIL